MNKKDLKVSVKGEDTRESEKSEKTLDPFSMAVKRKKEQWYDHVKLSVGQLNVIIYSAAALLIVVFVLMMLEAMGIFKL